MGGLGIRKGREGKERVGRGKSDYECVGVLVELSGMKGEASYGRSEVLH